jgi:hypothetical protein
VTERRPGPRRVGLPRTGGVSNVRSVPQAELRRGARVTVVVALSALCALLVLVGDGRGAGAAAATNTATYQDSVGEDAAGPDIASVTVANDDPANLTFTVSIPNRPTLTGDMLVLLALDTDANPASGSADFGGADYIIELDGPLEGRSEAGLFRWDGSDFTATGVSQATLIFSYANGPTLKINASELGGTRRFALSVIAVTGVVLGPDGEPDFTNIHIDNAPDRGSYTYDVKITPPTLVLSNPSRRPLKPAAGKLYSQLVSVARSDGAALQGGTVTCRATAAGRAIRPTGSALVGSRATCTFRIPATAKGKTIRVTITVSSGGLTATRSFSARIV